MTTESKSIALSADTTPAIETAPPEGTVQAEPMEVRDDTNDSTRASSPLASKRAFFENVFKKKDADITPPIATRRTWTTPHPTKGGSATVKVTEKSPAATTKTGRQSLNAMEGKVMEKVNSIVKESSGKSQSAEQAIDMKEFVIKTESPSKQVFTISLNNSNQFVTISVDTTNEKEPVVSAVTRESTEIVDSKSPIAASNSIPAMENVDSETTKTTIEPLPKSDETVVAQAKVPSPVATETETNQDDVQNKISSDMNANESKDESSPVFSDLKEMWGKKAAHSSPISPDKDTIVLEGQEQPSSIMMIPKSKDSQDVQEEKKEDTEDTHSRSNLSVETTPSMQQSTKTTLDYGMTPRSAMASNSPSTTTNLNHLWKDSTSNTMPDTPQSKVAMRASQDPANKSDSVTILRTTPRNHPVVAPPSSNAVPSLPTVKSLQDEVEQTRSNTSMIESECKVDEKRPASTSPVNTTMSPKQTEDDAESTARESVLLQDTVDRAQYITSPLSGAKDSEDTQDTEPTNNIKEFSSSKQRMENAKVAPREIGQQKSIDETTEARNSDSEDDDESVFSDLREKPSKPTPDSIYNTAASITSHAKRSMEKFKATMEIAKEFCPNDKIATIETKKESFSSTSPIGEYIKKFEAFSRGENFGDHTDNEKPVAGNTSVYVARLLAAEKSKSLETAEEIKAPSQKRFQFYSAGTETLTMLQQISEPADAEAFEEEQPAPKETSSIRASDAKNIEKVLPSSADVEEDEEEDEIARVTKNKAMAAVKKAAAKLSQSSSSHSAHDIEHLPSKETPVPEEAEGNPDVSILTDALTTAEMDTSLALDDETFENAMVLVGMNSNSTDNLSPKYDGPVSISRSGSNQQEVVSHAKCGEACVIM